MKTYKFYTGKEVALSIQHLFAMFGATVLVPLLTGINPALALVTAGLGTLAFHFVTKMKVPVFLGSSFAFIPGVAAVVATYGLQYAQGGIMVAGLVYLVLGVIVYFVGVDRIKKIFPSVVTGPIIIIIGLSLSYTAINDASGVSSGLAPYISWPIAFFVLAVVIFCMMLKKGMLKLIPILMGILAGYLLCVILNLCGVPIIDFTPISNAAWFNIPYVTEGFMSLPKFDITAILIIAPVAIVSFMEHIGDITTSSVVVGKDFLKDPGLHRTVMGDGVASIIAGFFGGPANTTYSENTGVLATTKNYDPRILRLTAVFAIFLGFIGKFGAVLQTIPAPVKGGIELVLFGLIASVGVRTLIEGKIDLTESRNIIIVSLILAIGVGVSIATYNPETMSCTGIAITKDFALSPLFLATIVGILANLILPKSKEKKTKEVKLSEDGVVADVVETKDAEVESETTKVEVELGQDNLDKDTTKPEISLKKPKKKRQKENNVE